MPIQCKNYKIRANGKVYVAGDVIEGLSKKEEARLVSEGYAEYVKIISDRSASSAKPLNELPDGPPEGPDDESEEDGPDTRYPESEVEKAKAKRGKK